MEKTFNKVENLGLYCHEINDKSSSKGVFLKCSFNPPKDKDTNEYGKGISTSVFCSFDNCDFDEDIKEGAPVNVWGSVSVSNYTNDKGNTYVGLTIFADKVEAFKRDTKKSKFKK